VAIEHDRAIGVTVAGELHPAGAVALAAGPWSRRRSATGWAPIGPLWGFGRRGRAADRLGTRSRVRIDALTDGEDAAGTAVLDRTALGRVRGRLDVPA